jgi:O-antigen/teichoic acid export membrane protein
VCLAYFFFSLHVHFVVPALLAKRTHLTLPAHLVALVANISLNLVLIPRFGIEGAAIASVVSFGLFSLVGLWVYRKIEVIPYRLGLLVTDLAGVVASFWIWSRYASWEIAPARTTVTALGLWLVWVVILARQTLRGTNWKAIVETVRAPAARGDED